jgi:hypothetical protein
MTKVRPRLEDCVDLYLAAHDRYGTDEFTAEQATAELAAASERLLELAVAYGLVEYDGTAYRVARTPDADADRWTAALTDRADRLRRAITDRRAGRASTGRDAVTVPFEDRQFASVFVGEDEGFEAVVDAVASLDVGDRDGVVLRSPGQNANAVQRIADRLCDATPEGTPLAASFQKEGTDVVGADKNELEFRLFLTRD